MAEPHTPCSSQSIEARLARFIADELLDEQLPAGVDPLAADAVDSLGLEQLVEHIWTEFDVMIGDEEMSGENFGSIAALSDLVESKRWSATE